MVFVVFGNPRCSLVEQLCVSGNLAFLLLLLHVVFVISGNPTFSLDEHPSSPEGGSIFVVPAF